MDLNTASTAAWANCFATTRFTSYTLYTLRPIQSRVFLTFETTAGITHDPLLA